MGNFDFLQKKKNFNSFNTACLEAEKSILVSPSTCATITRRALELAVKWLYANDSDLVLPYQDNLSTLIHNNSFIELIDYDMLPLLKYIVKLGNLSVHTSANIERGEAILSLNNLHQFVSWIDYCYSDEYTAEDFNEDLLLHGEEKRTRPDELKNLYERLSSKDKKLEEVIKENEELRKSLTEKRKVNTVNYDFKIDEVSEFETRKRYINIELKLAGWEFGKDIWEEIEVQGMPNESGVGYVDYVLYGENGKPLAVVEAKRTSKDPKIGQQQAKKSFTKLLPNLALCNLLDSKDSPEDARMIFSTYPTMMNAIDDTKSKDGKRLFTPGHFDLIIIDESHRSIYKKYKSIFDYFDSYLMGLTATPKDEIDKNTYSVFDMENGVPTYAYEYNKAVEDGYLVDYTSIEFKTKIMEDGIKYDELSDEEKEEYENTFNDDESIGDEIGNNAVNEWLFNSDTIDLVLNKLMTEGLKIEGEEKIGKTIIFAKNTKHARAIVERFNKLYPKYGGNFVKAVDYSINYVDSIIDDFSDKNKLPQIAVSVDMLDTGIDIPEILNLVFFKKVRSKTKFWQMIGRGTRLCPDLLGVDMDKERFLIFDFCNNFEFFKFNPKGFEGNKTETLTEKLFNIKVSMVKELQDIKYIEGEYAELRKELLEELITSVKALNEDSYIVRMNLSYVHKYKNENVWSNIGAVAQNEIREYISPLITSYSDDELAKRFDVVMYNIQLAYLQNNNASKGIRHVMATAEKLSKLGTIPQIQQQKYTIEKAMTEDFWEDSDIFEVEEVRISLRELIKYLEKSSQKIYYTSFEDMIVAEDRNDSVYNANNLKNYKKKVEYYLNSHKDELAIFKLRNNKKITKQDVETLEEILLKQLGNCDDYKKEFGDTPVSQLVRRLVGLDREAANEAFSEFLNNKSFNTKQIHFVKLIVDYVVKNGFIEDNKVLMEDPFRTVGSIIDLFENHIEERNKLIKTINKIKENASEIG